MLQATLREPTPPRCRRPPLGNGKARSNVRFRRQIVPFPGKNATLSLQRRRAPQDCPQRLLAFIPDTLQSIKDAQQLAPLLDGTGSPQPVTIQASQYTKVTGATPLVEEQTILSIDCAPKCEEMTKAPLKRPSAFCGRIKIVKRRSSPSLYPHNLQTPARPICRQQRRRNFNFKNSTVDRTACSSCFAISSRALTIFSSATSHLIQNSEPSCQMTLPPSPCRTC